MTQGMPINNTLNMRSVPSMMTGAKKNPKKEQASDVCFDVLAPETNNSS
jgi:hypothetical protein